VSWILNFFICLAINLTVLGTVVVLGVIVASRLARFASPRIRYVVAMICFVIAALLPLYLTAIPAKELAVLTAEAVQNDHRTSPTQILDSDDFTNLQGTHSDSRSDSFFAQLSGVVSLLGSTEVGVVFVAVWCLVGLLLLGREIVSQLYLMKARQEWRSSELSLRLKLSWPDNVFLYIHECEGPCTVGLLRPVVVLPQSLVTEFSCEEIQRVARHELAHVRWRDPLINSIFRMVRAVLWPSLPLWYLARVVNAEREAAADREAVIGENSQGNACRIASEYASSLVSIALKSSKESTSVYRLIAMQVNNGNGLEDRVKRLLVISNRPTRLRISLACSALLFSLGAVVFIPRASQASSPVILAANQNQKAFSKGDSTQVQKGRDQAARDEEIYIQMENSPNVPISITAASVKVVSVSPGEAIAAAPAAEQGSIIRPKLTLVNHTRERIRGLALSIVNADWRYEFKYQDLALTIEPYGTVTVDPGGFPFRSGDLQQLKVRIVGLRYERGGGWGQRVNRPYADGLPHAGNLTQSPVLEGESSMSASTAITSSNRTMVATTTAGTTNEGAYATPSRFFVDPVKAVEVNDGGYQKVTEDNGSTTSWKTAKGLIHRYGGGTLHEMALTKVQPIFPASAKEAGITGTVVIEVMVDENGDVRATRAQSGPRQLWNAARSAAQQWKFRPATDEGKPVKMVGELYFRF
jgi:TonB family protein